VITSQSLVQTASCSLRLAALHNHLDDAGRNRPDTVGPAEACRATAGRERAGHNRYPAVPRTRLVGTATGTGSTEWSSRYAGRIAAAGVVQAAVGTDHTRPGNGDAAKADAIVDATDCHSPTAAHHHSLKILG